MTEAYVYISKGLETWKLSEGGLFRKELIYIGTFSLQDTAGQRFKARIDEPQLHEWVRNFEAMLDAGIKVPLPIEHTTNPEKNRGFVTRMAVEKNKAGLPSLFGYIEFRDEEATRLTKTANVSIYVPPQFEDGNGKVYHRPIRHVALTDYPVIPKLDGFQAIAASLVLGESDMALRDLAKKLGVSVESDASDDVVEAGIVSTVTKLREKVKELETPEKKEEAPKIAAGFMDMARENRTIKIDRLVDQGKITPAVAEDLKKVHLIDAALSLSLTAETSDGFDALITALDKNEQVVSFVEKTGAQVQLSDAQKGDGTKSPLVANAEERAEAAK